MYLQTTVTLPQSATVTKQYNYTLDLFVMRYRHELESWSDMPMVCTDGSCNGEPQRP